MGSTTARPRHKDEHEHGHAYEHASEAAVPAPGFEAGLDVGLDVGAADDAYEVAADRAADAAVRRLAEGGQLGAAGGFGVAPTRAGAVGHDGGATDADTAERIQGARGGGAPLPASLRRSMESAFGGASFGGVRVHSGPEAADLNAKVGAHAFTVGRDIFLGRSMPSLDSAEGQHTLAHELAHTQQPAGSVHRLFGRGKKGKETLDAITTVSAPTAGAANKTSEGLEGFGKVGEVVKGGGGDVNDGLNVAQGYEGDYESAKLGHGSRFTDTKGELQLAEAGTAFAAFGLIADGANAVKVFIDGGKKTEKAEALIGVASSAGNLTNAAGAVSKGKNALENGGNASAAETAAAGIMESVAGSINAFKAGFKLIKDIVQIIRKADDMDDKEKVERTGVILKTSLEAAKGVVDIINGIFHKAGTMTSQLLHAAPGIGIAMNVMDAILNGVNIGYAYVSYSEMQDQKRGTKSKIQEKAVALYTEELKGQGKPEDEAKRLAQEKYGAQETMFGHRSGKAAADYVKKHASSVATDIEEADDYKVSKGLQHVSAKRINRGVANIATTLPAIAGDIATLSGVGAAVGGGLKAGSAGAKGLMTLLRIGKQAVRDAFTDASKGTRFEMNDEKTSAGKAATYDRMIVSMAADIGKANALPEADAPQKAAKAAAQKKVEERVGASGIRPRKLSELHAKPQELYAEWVSALKKR